MCNLPPAAWQILGIAAGAAIIISVLIWASVRELRTDRNWYRHRHD